METQLEAQNSVPKELGRVTVYTVNSFNKALDIISDTYKGVEALKIKGPLVFEENERQFLKLLPKTFHRNGRLQKLLFQNMEVNDMLGAGVLTEMVKSDKITSIELLDFEKLGYERFRESMCKGFKARSTAFELRLWCCSSKFATSILEASCLKCFSITMARLKFTRKLCPLKTFFSRGNLYYINLHEVKGLKDDIFLQLARVVLPNLVKLDFNSTEVPTSALKRLLGSLKMILDSGRSNMFEILNLGETELSNELSFAYFKLLSFDIFEEFYPKVKEDVSRAVVKKICSTVAKTKNLKYLHTRNNISSGTQFKRFQLQHKGIYFGSPFGVNPTAKITLNQVNVLF